MKLFACMLALASGTAALGRNEQFQWGTWTLKLKGSKYTHKQWATTVFQGGFQSDEFVVKGIRANFRLPTTVDGQKDAQMCTRKFRVRQGVEALYTRDGHFIRTLSCDNQDARILSATFKAAPAPGYGAWKISLKGSRYTHNWKSVNWNGNTAGFQIKEVSPYATGPEQEHAQMCKRKFRINGAEALYSAEGEFISNLSCDNQDAHVLHASWEKLESVDVEMVIAETKESFTEDKKESLRDEIAKELGLRPDEIIITVGVKANKVSRRLIGAGELLITVTIKGVLPTEFTKEIETLASPTFATKVAAATGITATFKAFKPAHGSSICATCEWDGTKIHVTHYINAQKHGEKGLQHKCYHESGTCKCECM